MRVVGCPPALQSCGLTNPANLGMVQYVYLCLSLQSCLILCDPMDRNPPGSSIHGILQARILEWVARLFSGKIFPTQGLNPGLLPCKQILYCLKHQESSTWMVALKASIKPCLGLTEMGTLKAPGRRPNEMLVRCSGTLSTQGLPSACTPVFQTRVCVCWSPTGCPSSPLPESLTSCWTSSPSDWSSWWTLLLLLTLSWCIFHH